MAPIRRYLRISKYSVLECRIYLEYPPDSRWLLDSRDPVLPRVIAAVRPSVLPKLREENERLFLRKKGKPVKDVIIEDDFEVAIFLRQSRTRHSLLTRSKTFQGKDHEDQDVQMEVEPDHVSGDTAAKVNSDGEIMIESDSEPDLELHNIPESADEVALGNGRRSSKRRRTTREGQVPPEDTTGNDEKKLRFSTHYESFIIHGWVLCLLITRKGDKARPSAAASESNRPLVEEWISTQAQASVDDD
ncbi:hypothetical protein CBS147332_4668 [Penicillium roqueforti]|nr:hypothetical protein CBS147332_4668 [Penicillium roqueforti]KAI3119390.1 hypothetical protein CBS147331_2802 [Penicillium roqueforti]